jgi:hypothetical protein
VRLAVDPLEQRLLLDGGGVFGAAAPNGVPVGGLIGGITVSTDLVLDPVNSPEDRDREMGLPLLDSNPGAPVALYLDFTGNFEATWWNSDGDFPKPGRPVVTPVFNLDNDPTKFGGIEQGMIKEIWARVAEDFAPFNVNVTTHYYGGFNDGQALKVAIGGLDTDWYTVPSSGTSNIGSFSNSEAPNVVFVFSESIRRGVIAGGLDGDGRPIDFESAVATCASHEAGHAFGLLHHSRYNFEYDGTTQDLNGNLKGKTEYDPGTAAWTPIMGNSLDSDRTTWDADPTDLGPDTFQDDLAVIGGPANGFGFRADDHGNTTATATPLTQPVAFLPRMTGKGIINDWKSDMDFFSFTTGGGALQVQVDAAPLGPNLIPVAELWSDHGPIARADAGGFTQSIIHANLPAGTYFVLVKSFGDYGDEGQYTVTVDFPQVVAQSADGGVASVPPPPALSARVVSLKGQALVKVFDARTGGLRRTLKPFGGSAGKVSVALIDVNGDGIADLVVSARVNGKVRKKVYSGTDLSPLPSGPA